MLCDFIGKTGAGGSWSLYVRLQKPSDPEEVLEHASFMLKVKGKSKYKPCKHSKADGLICQIGDVSWRKYFAGKPNARLVTSDWDSPTTEKGYTVHLRFGGRSPIVPDAYDSRTEGCRLNSYYHWVDGGVIGKHPSIRQDVVWIDDTGRKRLAAYRLYHDYDEPFVEFKFQTAFSPVIDMQARTDNWVETLAFMAYESKLARELYRGDHTISLVDQMHATTMNQFEFLGDLNLVKQVMDVAEKAVSLDWGGTLKELSDVYLTYSFGASSTARDYVELAGAISKEAARYIRVQRYRDRKVHTRSTEHPVWLGSPSEARLVTTAYMDNFDQGIMGIMSALDSWGMYPDLSAVWEKVPFSFVVDWFANIQRNLNRIDANIWREYYNIRACICSTKLKTVYDWQTVHPGSRLAGQASISLYHRWIQYSLPQPMVDLDIGLPSGVHQWITGAALVVQKSKR
jgi:hypothetical protein